VAVERSDRDVVALIKRERLAGRVPVSHGGVVAQVWRGGTGRHLAVARLLAGTDIAAPDDRLRRRTSVLLARRAWPMRLTSRWRPWPRTVRTSSPSDPGDLQVLAQAAGVHVELIPV